jgi:hypothetical protein
MLLVDSKRYGAKSVGLQCEKDDVNKLKVDVVAERLRARSVEVETVADDLYAVPDGAAGPEKVIVSTLDNRHGEIGVNRLALRMQSRLVKVNVEPKLELASVRCFDFRSDPSLCLECQFTDKQYREQRHPKSCDGGGAGRRTASPRRLSEAAAALGSLAFAQILNDAAAAHWYGHEYQVVLSRERVLRSTLAANPHCRAEHAGVWHELERLERGPAALSLADLLDRAGIAPAAAVVTVRSCHRVSLRARCRSCGTEARHIHWLRELDARIGECPRCGGALQAVPFWASWQFRLDEMWRVWKKPLATWGVPPLAVLEFTAGTRRKAFVVGESGGQMKGHAS